MSQLGSYLKNFTTIVTLPLARRGYDKRGVSHHYLHSVKKIIQNIRLDLSALRKYYYLLGNADIIFTGAVPPPVLASSDTWEILSPTKDKMVLQVKWQCPAGETAHRPS